jgi:hypothetical protein
MAAFTIAIELSQPAANCNSHARLNDAAARIAIVVALRQQDPDLVARPSGSVLAEAVLQE